MNRKIYKGYELAEAIDNGILDLKQRVNSAYDMEYYNCTIDFILRDDAKNVMFKEFELLEDNTEEQEKLGESWKEVGKRVGEWAKEFEQGFKESFTEIINYPFKNLEDNTEEIEELDNWFVDERKECREFDIQAINLCFSKHRDKINELVKAVNEIRKDLNK